MLFSQGAAARFLMAVFRQLTSWRGGSGGSVLPHLKSRPEPRAGAGAGAERAAGSPLVCTAAAATADGRTADELLSEVAGGALLRRGRCLETWEGWAGLRPSKSLTAGCFGQGTAPRLHWRPPNLWSMSSGYEIDCT